MKMKMRYQNIEDLSLQVIEEDPGINGSDLVDSVNELFLISCPDQLAAEEEEVFAVLDDLIDKEAVFFDASEDTWHIHGSPEMMTIIHNL